MASKKKGNGNGFFGVLILAGVIFALANHSHIPGFHHHTNNKSCRQMERLWIRAGGSRSEAFMAAEIAEAESSGSQYSTDYDSNGTVDRGYWQINSVHGWRSTFNPMGNARAAVYLSNDGTNWTPWVTYNEGLYAGRC